MSWAVSIYNRKNFSYLLLREYGFGMRVEDIQQLASFYDSIPIFVHLLKDSKKVVFVLIGVQLRCNKGVDYSFKFIFEMKLLKVCYHLHLNLIYLIFAEGCHIM